MLRFRNHFADSQSVLSNFLLYDLLHILKGDLLENSYDIKQAHLQKCIASELVSDVFR